MSDCMTQEGAERMDASQAVQILKPLRAMMLDQYGCPISDAYFALDKAIEALKQPTIDAVEVVRCRDCEYWYPEEDDEYGHCRKHDFWSSKTWFCADGERREDEG